VQVVVDKAVGGEQAMLADLTPGSTVEVRTTTWRQQGVIQLTKLAGGPVCGVVCRQLPNTW
jgi:hypothetical protein